MQTHNYSIRSWSAMLMGLLMAATTGYILFEDVFHGAPITTAHVASAAALLATLYAVHSVVAAWRERAYLSALACAMIFVGGTGYIVTSSGARNAEVAANKTAKVASDNTEREAAQRDISVIKGLIRDEQIKLSRECGSGKGKRCEGIQTTIASFERQLAGAQAVLEKLGAPKQANLYAQAAKTFAALPYVTAKPDEIEARLTLILPYVLVFIIEISTVTFLGMAFGHQPTLAPKTKTERRPAPSLPSPEPTQPKGRKTRKDVAEAEVIQLRRPAAQEDLAGRWGVAKSTVSEWVNEWEAKGLITRHREGRYMMVQAARLRVVA